MGVHHNSLKTVPDPGLETYHQGISWREQLVSPLLPFQLSENKQENELRKLYNVTDLRISKKGYGCNMNLRDYQTLHTELN